MEFDYFSKGVYNISHLFGQKETAKAMQLSDSARMREADAAAIAGGIDSLTLMENAAEALADEMEREAETAAEAFGPTAAGECSTGEDRCGFTVGTEKTAVLLCGAGNNGGDGFAAAHCLKRRGWGVQVFFVGEHAKMTADCREMARRFVADGGAVADFDPANPRQTAAVLGAAVVGDAIFGIGLNAPVQGAAAMAINLLNSCPAPIVAADIPSGVEADTGRILGDAVCASATVTFTRAKPGHFVEPGCVCCGAVRVRDIGIPAQLADRAEIPVSAVLPGELKLPVRYPVTHKGDYGRLLLLGGSVGYTGAPALAALAALRAGAGLVTLAVPESIYAIEAAKCDEAMPAPLPSENGRLAEGAVDALAALAGRADVCAAGPGLGRGPGVTAAVRWLLENWHKPLVLDADALNAAAEMPDALCAHRGELLLTPHEGEFVRLGGELTGDRLGDARRAARAWGCTLLLKGHRSILAFPDGTAHILTNGNPGMAKGGSGDVLTGVAAALAGQLPWRRAVLTAAYLHALAGDLGRDKFGEYGLLAGDIIELLPAAERSIMEE